MEHAKNIDLVRYGDAESTSRHPVGSLRRAGVYVSVACHSTACHRDIRVGPVPGGWCISGGLQGWRRHLSAALQRDVSVGGVRVRDCVATAAASR
jgi:hypothetical protein